jgi:SAM-dependent methyltransferase
VARGQPDSEQFIKHAPDCVAAILSASLKKTPLPTASSHLHENLAARLPEKFRPCRAIGIPIPGGTIYLGIALAFLSDREISVEDIDELERLAERLTFGTLLVPYFNEKNDDRLKAVNSSSPLRLVRVRNPKFGDTFSTTEFHMVPRFSQGVINRGNIVAAELVKQIRKTAHIFLSDIAAPTYDGEYVERGSAGVRFYKEEERRLLNQFVGQIGGREIAVELGCGTGRESFELAKSFDKIYAYDFSSRMIQVAQEKKVREAGVDHAGERLSWKIRFHVRDIEIHPPPLQMNSIDLCAGLFGMGSFVEDIDKFLNHYREMLKPGGGIVLSFYNRKALLYSNPPPWRYPAISSRLETDRQELIVTLPDGNMFRVFCRSYDPKEIREKFEARFEDVSIHSFPLFSGFLPRDYVDDPAYAEGTVAGALCQIDKILMGSDQTPLLGNYLLAFGRKPPKSRAKARLEISDRLLGPNGVLVDGGLVAELVEHEPLRRGTDVVAALNSPEPYLRAVLFFARSGRGRTRQKEPIVCVVDARRRVSKVKLAKALRRKPETIHVATEREISSVIGDARPPLPIAGYDDSTTIVFDRSMIQITSFLTSVGQLTRSAVVRGNISNIPHTLIADISEDVPLDE